MFRRRRPSTNIDARDLADYGNPVRKDINVAAAARGMGVGQAAIKAAMAKTQAAVTNTFMRGISGRPDADSSGGGGPLGKLQAAFGRGPRGGAVNARHAADKLGVSPATIRRWAKGSQTPSADHEQALAKAARQATSTKAGRRSLTNDFRNSAKGKDALTNGAQVWVSGYQGPWRGDAKTTAQRKGKSASDDYCRERRSPLDYQRPLEPQQIEEMLRAYEDGGDSGLYTWMIETADKGYLDGWEFITIDRLEIGNEE